MDLPVAATTKGGGGGRYDNAWQRDFRRVMRQLETISFRLPLREYSYFWLCIPAPSYKNQHGIITLASSRWLAETLHLAEVSAPAAGLGMVQILKFLAWRGPDSTVSMLRSGQSRAAYHPLQRLGTSSACPDQHASRRVKSLQHARAEQRLPTPTTHHNIPVRAYERGRVKKPSLTVRLAGGHCQLQWRIEFEDWVGCWSGSVPQRSPVTV